MIPFTVHDSTGRILRSGTCQPDMLELQALPGETAVQGSANDQTDHVLDGVVSRRPNMYASASATTVKADGTDMVTIDGVLQGTDVTITGPTNMSGTTEGNGPITLTFAIVGTYKVKLSRFPNIDMEIVINAI